MYYRANNQNAKVFFAMENVQNFCGSQISLHFRLNGFFLWILILLLLSCIKLCILYHNQRLTGTNHKHYEAPTRILCYLAKQLLQKQFHTKSFTSFWSFQKFIMEMFLPALSPPLTGSQTDKAFSVEKVSYICFGHHTNIFQ